MAAPPPYPSSVSISRHRTSNGSIHSLADALLRSSLSNGPTPSPRHNSPPASDTWERSTVASSRRPSTRRSQVEEQPPSLNPSAYSTVTPRRTSAEGLHPKKTWSSTSSTVYSASSSTREKLRLIERERSELLRAVEGERANAEEMRRLAEKERALVDRLKREGGASGASLTPSEAKRRIHELELDARVAGAEISRRASGMFKAVCSTDLLFLIDTTGSMSSYIDAAKKQVMSIVDDIKAAFFNDVEVRIAVVGYKDHGDMPNIEFLDFTTSIERVRSFIGKLRATGGGDAPEDVLGGIRKALGASWKHQTRCIIHIADAPAHGSNLHNPAMGDDYPEPGSEPHGLTFEPLIGEMIGLNINYALLRILSRTDLMAYEFFKIYAAASADGMLNTKNSYYIDAMSTATSLRTVSRNGSQDTIRGGLLFEEAELGTTYRALRHLVVSIVTSSASRTAVRMSAARASKDGLSKKSGMESIMEDEDDTGESRLEKVSPKWDAPGWLDETLVVEGFSPDVVVHNASTLNDMIAHDDNIKMSVTELTIRKRSRPFAQGSLRVASYASTAASTNHFVVKSFKRRGKRLAHLAEDMRCQALCKAFALEFNSFSGESQSLDFIVTTCLKGKPGSGAAADDSCLSLEPLINGEYIKYNTNSGYVNTGNGRRSNQAAQAFSHFTFERSRGNFMVSDLQGVGFILTDPAVHTHDPERFKLSDTNLGEDGFKFFFATHVCNDICKKLGLQSNASMVMSGKYTFRTKWPLADNTVCCSNKLCGSIIRLSSAKKSNEYPGYHWCQTCYPQLSLYSNRWICVAPGPYHEFDVSKFFYESQGRRAPRECPEHRNEGEVAPQTAPIDNSVWARLKSATKMKSSDMSSRILRKRTSSLDSSLTAE